MKKWIAFLLPVLIILCLLTGCDNGAVVATKSQPSVTTTNRVSAVTSTTCLSTAVSTTRTTRVSVALDTTRMTKRTVSTSTTPSTVLTSTTPSTVATTTSKVWGKSSWTLSINGVSTTEWPGVLMSPDGYPYVPLVYILERIGADITWLNDVEAIVKYNSEEYILDWENKIFVRRDLADYVYNDYNTYNTYNLLELKLSGGSDYPTNCFKHKGELFVIHSVMGFFIGEEFGFDAVWDYDEKRYVVNTREDDSVVP